MMSMRQSISMNANAETVATVPMGVLLQALIEMGEPVRRARKLMDRMDQNNDGVVDRDEWAEALEELTQGKGRSDVDFLDHFMERMETKIERCDTSSPPRVWCLLHFQSTFRISWD